MPPQQADIALETGFAGPARFPRMFTAAYLASRRAGIAHWDVRASYLTRSGEGVWRSAQMRCPFARAVIPETGAV